MSTSNSSSSGSDAKDVIKRDISALGFSVRDASASTIQVVFTPRASFSNIERCIITSTASASRERLKIELSIAAVKKELVLSIRCGKKRAIEHDTLLTETRKSHSEAIFYQSVDDSIAKILKVVKGTENEGKVKKAAEILYRFETLRSMDGCAERSVQSFGVFVKRLPTNNRPIIMLAVRLNTATPVRISEVRKILSDSWADGVFSTEDKIEGLEGVELPFSEEADVCMQHGNHPLLIVTSVV